MGFLSKFFGGDAGTPPQKPESAEAPRSAPEPERAAEKRDAPVAAQPPADASRPASKEEVTVNARAPKEVLPPKDATPKEAVAVKEAAAKDAAAKDAAAKDAAAKEAAAVKAAAATEPPAPAPAPKAAGPAAPGASKGVPPSTGKNTGGLPPSSKLGAPPPKLGGPADKPRMMSGKPATDKGAALADKNVPAEKPAPADKAPADKAPADKAAAAPEKPAAGAARAIPPERRKALEDSVITSAPKLPGDPAARVAPAARPPAKAAAKTAPANPPAKAASGEKPAPGSGDAAGVPPLRPRRDHSKSPGFYSSVSPEHAADAVSGGPFAPAQNKKATVVGLAPPPDPAKGAAPSRPDVVAPETLAADAAAPQAGRPEARFEPVPPVTSALAEPVAALVDPSKLASAPADATEAEPLVDLRGLASEDDDIAPPTPCSTPPSVSPVAREEKEETSPGLGNTRSRHDPSSQLINGTDLELLLAFALDLALGCASDAWFVPLRAAVGRLLAGDAAIRSSALEKALTTLANDLEQPGAFSEDNRQRLYGHVVAVDLALAKRMDVTGQKAIRERLIVDQLLEEIALAHPMVTRRIKDQGPLSLETLARSSAEDLSQKLEAPTETAAQVASIFQGYLEARVQRGPTVALLGKSVALRERVSALEASAEAFDRASEGDDPSARRNTRKQRQNDVTQLNLLLAEFGEAKTLAEIERCSVQAKIERMQRLIQEQEANSGRRAAKPSSPA